jgi:hypothetical protein
VLAGLLAPIVGLITSADFYGIGVILLGGSFTATMLRRKGSDLLTA